MKIKIHPPLNVREGLGLAEGDRVRLEAVKRGEEGFEVGLDVYLPRSALAMPEGM